MKATLGFALCGSFCTYRAVIGVLPKLTAEYDVIPIFSDAGYRIDSRFGPADAFVREVEELCGKKALHKLEDVEPLGPKKLLDLLIVAPCTGNTLGKLANGIADSPVTFACKAHLRNARPILLAVSTNDGLGASGENMARLCQRKHYYFVPYGQDDPFAKPQSLKADLALLPAAVDAALRGEQLQPVLLGQRNA